MRRLNRLVQLTATVAFIAVAAAGATQAAAIHHAGDCGEYRYWHNGTLRRRQGETRQGLDGGGLLRARPPSRKAHGLALRRPGDLAVPHHAPAAHDGADGPALHR